MKIIIEKYEKTDKMQARAEEIRESGHGDIIIMTKKEGAAIGIVVSHEFDDRCLNADYCKEKNVEVVRSDLPYGAYGNLVSVPGNTFVMHVPRSNEGIYGNIFFAAMLDAYSVAGNVSGSGNDIIIDGKKLMGVAVYPNQIVAIGSLYGFPADIDNIYSDYFRENSGKVMPSERVAGLNTFTNGDYTLRVFAERIKEAFNKLGCVKIDEIIEIDMEG